MGNLRVNKAAVRVWVLATLLGTGLLVPALLAPWLAPHPPQALELLGSLSLPSSNHLLGQDEQGGDILSRILYGARISLLVGLVSTGISAGIGIAVGLLAGLAGGWIEQLCMRCVDVLLAFPGLLLAIALAAMLGPGLENVIIALCVLGWTGFARLVRAQTLQVKEYDYVLAAHAMGCGPLYLAARCVFPNVLAPVLVQASFAIAAAILAEASLSFLGLGAAPGTPSWGAMLAEGRRVLEEAPHVSIFPGLAIMLTVLGFNLLGDALADYLDPKRQG